MRLLVISDTHLQNDLFERINEKYYDMDLYIHCGDSSLNESDPLLEKYFVVNGNHDEPETFAQNIIFLADKFKCLITHGNTFNIYYENELLLNYMKENDIDIAFHGHTHVPSYTIIDNKQIINPGSVMINRGTYGFGTFAIVDIDHGHVETKYYNSKTFEECSELVLQDGLKMLAEFKKILK